MSVSGAGLTKTPDIAAEKRGRSEGIPCLSGFSNFACSLTSFTLLRCTSD